MSEQDFTLSEIRGNWRWVCGQCNGYGRNFPTAQKAQDDFHARHVHCQRPECGGQVHADGRGTPIRCPARRCPRCDCPDGHEQCDHCKVCPYVGGSPEEPRQPSPLDQQRADNESLRYQIRRAREALATDEPGAAEAAIARVRQLHREGYGACEHCTRADSVPYPCPTIRALDGDTTSKEQA